MALLHFFVARFRPIISFLFDAGRRKNSTFRDLTAFPRMIYLTRAFARQSTVKVIKT